MHKGATVEELVQAVLRAKEADRAVSVMVLIGLAGRERSLTHARLSAEAVSRMAPTYTALLTYTPIPGSPLFEEINRGAFELPTAEGSLREIREFLSRLQCRPYSTCNHASNYPPLRGKLPAARQTLLGLLDAALQGEIPLRPEFLRGL